MTLAPWIDCPKCPTCGTACGVPIEPGDRFYPAKEGVADLWCPACGQGWVGFPGEVKQAARAQAAWERKQDEDEQASRDATASRRDREKYERLMRGEW